MHVFFPALALVCLGLSVTTGLLRGLGLFLVCVSAVVVRETARLMMAAYLDLKLRAVLLLPIGGLFAYANPESQEASNQGFGQFAMALTGPHRELRHRAHARCRLHRCGRRRAPARRVP